MAAEPGLKISMVGLTFGFVLGALGCYFSNIWFLVFGRIISGITASFSFKRRQRLLILARLKQKPLIYQFFC